MTTEIIMYIGLNIRQHILLMELDGIDVSRHEDGAGTAEYWVGVDENSMRTLTSKGFISVAELRHIRDKEVSYVIFF